MTDVLNSTCAICLDSPVKEGTPGSTFLISCEACNEYHISSESFADFRNVTLDPEKRFLLSSYINSHPRTIDDPYTSEILSNLILNIQKPNVELIVYRFLQYLSENSSYGEPAKLTHLHAKKFFFKSFGTFQYLLVDLEKAGYISGGSHANGGVYYITLRGIEYLKNAKKLDSDNSTKVFVAMWFSSETDESYKYIKDAIKYQGYECVRADEQHHTEDINDFVLQEIRSSKFLVVDLTGHRGGAYFEAGTAFGLGIPIIYCCREDWFQDKLFKECDKAGNLIGTNPINYKAHFDVEHRLVIPWKQNELLLLQEKLSLRIGALFGKAK